MALSEAKRESTWLENKSYLTSKANQEAEPVNLSLSRHPYRETEDKNHKKGGSNGPNKRSNGLLQQHRTKPAEHQKKVPFGTAERRQVGDPMK